jgi:DNA-binding response OmpR family regulator
MLLHELWPRGTDVHVAEVAVSRLRRRLGGRLRISVVPQRGYVLTGV